MHALRAANELTLSIVAEERGQIIGHVALSPVTITDGQERQAEGWYGLEPVSVLPHRQGQGIGSRLMAQALRAMQAAVGRPAHVHWCRCRSVILACEPTVSADAADVCAA